MKERGRERKGKKKKMERERDIVFYACWWDNNDADLYKKKLNVKREKTQRPSKRFCVLMHLRVAFMINF